MQSGYKYQFIYILEDGTRGAIKITSEIKCVERATIKFKYIIKNVSWFTVNHLGYERNR